MHNFVRRFPWGLAIVAVLLMLVGLACLGRRAQLGLIGQSEIGRQSVFIVIGVAVLIIGAVPNYRRLIALSYVLFGLTLVLLVAVYAFPPINHAHRWIPLGPIRVQPSEFAKVVLVLTLARYLMHRDNYRRLAGLLVPLGVSMVPVLLILREPDLGTSLVLLPIVLVMLFTAGAKRIHLAVVLLCAAACVPVLWTQMSEEQQSRVTALFEQPAADVTPSDAAFHLHWAKRTRAMGGFWGSAITGTSSDDRGVYFLPAAKNDFVFSVVGEYLGIPGMLAVLGLCGLLVWQCVSVAVATEEPFGRLIAAGVATLFAVEVVINTAMNLGLMPITGLSLPLLSYGGSGLVAHALAIALVCNVAMHPSYDVSDRPFRYSA